MESRSQEIDRAKALLQYTQKMSAMIDVGISLARCNGVISQDGPVPYDEFCKALQERWERNDIVTLSDAMKERSDLFPPFYISIIRMGEVGGVLEEFWRSLTLIWRNSLS